MEEINVVYKLQRYLKDSIESCTQSLLSGDIDNMEKYKYIVGQVRAYEQIQQELSSLLEEKEQ